MRVNLISYTGHGSGDPLYAAKLLVYTKNTRLEQGEATRQRIWAMGEEELFKELNYIANTIRSSWEFVDYTFEIQDVTRAFTHQLVRTRTASYAQQTQRAIDMSEFGYLLPDTVNQHAEAAEHWGHCMQQIRSAYVAMRAAGIPAQDARGILPTNIHTNIIMKVNLRTLADLLPKRKSLRAQGEYTEVAAQMEDAVLSVHPWAKEFLSPVRKETPALDALIKGVLGSRSPTDVPAVSGALKELEKLKAVWG